MQIRANSEKVNEGGRNWAINTGGSVRGRSAL